ncbi:MAG: NADH-quinone oxidoreductase subunit A [Thermaerobacter sp.]|nr:NADH-quinone oxidoreductase subunit A [Thermaerobacter sp.]MDA8147069.1 NADH-quinone oxidoreductase subunit A [Thermaerobacter sp.]
MVSLSAYFPVLVYAILALAVAVATSFMSQMLRRRRPVPGKNDPYECGIVPETQVNRRFSVKFYLIAVLFMILDVEAVAFYPWAVYLHHLLVFGFLEMFTFIVVLAVGYAYIWKKGGFKWQ